MATYHGASGLILLPQDTLTTSPSGLQNLTRQYACRAADAPRFRALMTKGRQEDYNGQTFYLFTVAEKTDGVIVTFSLNCYGYISQVFRAYGTELRSLSWTVPAVRPLSFSAKYLSPTVTIRYAQLAGNPLQYVDPAIPGDNVQLFEISQDGVVYAGRAFETPMVATVLSENQTNYGRVEEVELKFAGVARGIPSH